MRFKRTGILTKMIIVFLLVYAVMSLVNLRGKIADAEKQQAALEQQVADITAENDAMQYALDNRDDDKVIEDIARREGYVYQDEEVYYAR